MRTLLCTLCLILPASLLPAQVPGEEHREARQMIAGGDLDGAIEALDAVLESAPDDCEALLLRASAYEQQENPDRAWADYDGVARLERASHMRDDRYLELALQGRERTNEFLAAVREAQAELVGALEQGLQEAEQAGDLETARLAAVTILRVQPLHEAARTYLQRYRSDSRLEGCWINLFDPVLAGYEKPQGTWVPVPGEETYLVEPGSTLDGVAELLLPIAAPDDLYELEATYEVLEANTGSDTRPGGALLGFGRGDGRYIVIADMRATQISVQKQTGQEFEAVGERVVAPVPGEGRPFTMGVRVMEGKLLVDFGGSQVYSSPEPVAEELTGKHLAISTQRTRTLVSNLRFRLREMDGPEPDRKEIAAAEKLVRRKDEGCMDAVSLLLEQSPNLPALLLLRAEAALALGDSTQALAAYRRVLEEKSSDKKERREAERALKKLTHDLDLEKLLKGYCKALDAADSKAPRGFGAEKLRVLELQGAVTALDRKDARAREKLLADEDSRVAWLDLPLDVGGACEEAAGSWSAEGNLVSGRGAGRGFGSLLTSCTVGDAFEVSVEYRFQCRGKADAGALIAVGEPHLLWDTSYPGTSHTLAAQQEVNKSAVPVLISKPGTEADQEWHSMRIVVDRGLTWMHVDGKLELWGPLPEGFERLTGKPLYLGCTGGPVEYRNLRYRDRW